MQATTHPTQPTSTTGLLGAPSGELVLQICGGEHDGRILRLTAAKCTIGSAPGCTLRLRARGIRPVHALILRGPAGAIVRCWSADAQLNDRGFSEAQLVSGDKLQFGPISLSVVELATRPSVSPKSIPAAPSIDDAPELRTTRRPNRNRRKQLFGFLRQERQQQSGLQATIDSQAAHLATLEEQVEKLQAERDAALVEVPPPAPVDDLLTQQFTRTIEQLRQELETAAKRRSVEQQSLARQRSAWEEQSEQRLQAELGKLRTELEANRRQASAATVTAENYERQIDSLEQQRVTLSREVESLKLALDTKTKAEELARQNAASQLEQLSQTFALVSRERDELFERLHTEEPAREATASYWQAQLEEARHEAEAQIDQAQIAAQLQISRLREEFAKREHQLDEELIAHTTNEGQRSAADAERIQKLTAELETIRAEARQASTAAQQQQDGFTQARKRFETEIAALNLRLQESEQALHTARINSGELQAAVLAEAEQARNQRDAVREQMLRQQQDWTEFRSRLESASSEERELARLRYAALEEDFNNRTRDITKTQAEYLALKEQLQKLEIELEQTQESLFAAEHGANQRLQQMTISMESLQLDRGSAQSQIEQERAEWEQERNSLATCVTELQQELAKLTQKLQSFEQQSEQADSDNRSRLSTTEKQLQAAQDQLTEWQTTAEQAQRHVDELSREVAKLQQQEQVWQLEREQLDRQQEDSTDRLQQLEASITELQQQLDDAQRAVAVTCPPPGNISHFSAVQQADFGSTINVNNQELAALREQQNLDAGTLAHAEPDFNGTININDQELAALRERQDQMGGSLAQPENEFGGTINVNNQELAALCEQRNESLPSLLVPRLNPQQLAAFQAREALLQEKVDDLAELQQKLEEEQSTVARQRIELESFQASLLELEKSLTERAEALMQQASIAEPREHIVNHDDHDHLYGEPERESNPLSESEAFAAMADQLAALNPPNKDAPPALTRAPQDAAEEESELSESLIVPTPAAEDRPNDAPSPEPFEAVEAVEAVESTIAEAAEPANSSAIIEPVAEDEFDRQLDARIARVMRREGDDWQTTPAADSNNEQSSSESPAANEAAASSESPAVNNVLDRLREAGLWKGEGTAKGDQLPSSNHPLDNGGPGLCRLSESGPIVGDAPIENQAEPEASGAAAPEPDELSLIAETTPPRASLLNTPAKDDDADDSIESYMSRLMQRLKTTDDEPNPRKTSGSPQTRAPQTRAAQGAPAALAPPKPKPTDSRPLTSLEELSPRSPAPELSSNLAAMREVANSAARGAIAVHCKQNKRQKVNLRSINTLMALLVSAGLLFIWTKTGSWIAMGGVGLSLLWAISSCLVAVMQSLTLRKADRTEQNTATTGETAE